MKKFIKKITTNIPYTQERIEINLDGKDLIITGANGSGKTSLLNSIHIKLTDIVRSKKLDKLKDWNIVLEHLKKEKKKFSEGTSQHQQAIKQVEEYKNLIQQITDDPKIEISDHLEFSKKVDSELGLIELFPALRQSSIQDARSASGTSYNRKDLSNQRSSAKIGNQLEQHLVNLYTRRSFSITESENPEIELEITDWLSEFDKNLKFLIEDKSVHIDFDADNFKVFIHQGGRLPYTFQNLSSGYSSIFSIFSTLLMRAEYLKLSPSKLCGVALIDEIDAHLHVSLQRKILPFLSASFPDVQFIVTTHSPFVLTSVNETVIFDLGRKEQVENLSSYSYEAVLQGLFDVHSASDILQNKIKDIATYIETESIDIPRLKELIMGVEENSKGLDEESLFFLNQAKLLITKESLKS